MYRQNTGNESTDRISRVIVDSGQVYRLPDNAKWLRAEFGQVWMTDGTRDVILSLGRTYNPDHPATTVVSALGDQPAGLVVGTPCEDPSEQARTRLRTLAYNRP